MSKGKKKVQKSCDNCGQVFTTTYGDWPEQLCHFCHRCDNCGHAMRCVMREIENESEAKK